MLVQFDFVCNGPFGQDVAEAMDGLAPAIENLNAKLFDVHPLEQAVMQFGPLGPFLIIGLMTVAIVMSPIPSAPIALASGAAYGHYWGAFYVAIGSEIGALTAFGVARLFGYDALKAWLGTRLSMGVLHRFITSQNALMAVVFATRLMPFLSFDIISYAAGLTPLRTWRFAVATLFGIIPASFLLAHFGDELASGDWRRAGLTQFWRYVSVNPNVTCLCNLAKPH
ncbi:SNARE associated Golgi protein [Thecamonas trahens ATCC 50062]|uniref:SNARE associated Golgi protein n=1 Tax=Thecamonas trahens ATCC 50062 TaxID=461836 RepID=A0A0L0DUL5_THETB|nr:SNARE associated Golgi protein [Thecamonas trahens ATCC 50062]KNC55892.1 SNARE associated Golgi protein [Thecamonas trahens ATCC 50062]|eukprot:XP_013752756.1 SNARE associated Golgi protein [Thecamonas trahens ATCC 50062]